MEKKEFLLKKIQILARRLKGTAIQINGVNISDSKKLETLIESLITKGE